MKAKKEKISKQQLPEKHIEKKIKKKKIEKTKSINYTVIIGSDHFFKNRQATVDELKRRDKKIKRIVFSNDTRGCVFFETEIERNIGFQTLSKFKQIKCTVPKDQLVKKVPSSIQLKYAPNNITKEALRMEFPEAIEYKIHVEGKDKTVAIVTFRKSNDASIYDGQTFTLQGKTVTASLYNAPKVKKHKKIKKSSKNEPAEETKIGVGKKNHKKVNKSKAVIKKLVSLRKSKKKKV